MIITIGNRGLSLLRGHAPRVHLVLVLLAQAGEIVESSKDHCSLVTCHDREAGKMAKQRMVWTDKIPMAAASCGRRRPQFTRYLENFSGKWKEISAEIVAVGTTVKEMTNTWNKSCKENVKRETELYRIVEAAVMDEKQEQKNENWSGIC